MAEKNIPLAKSILYEIAFSVPGLPIDEFRRLMKQEEIEKAADELGRIADAAQPLSHEFWETFSIAYNHLLLPKQSRTCRFRITDSKHGYVEATLTLNSIQEKGILTDARVRWGIGNVTDDGKNIYNDGRLCLEDSDILLPGKPGLVRIHPLHKKFWTNVKAGQVITLFDTQILGEALVIANKLRY